MFKTTQHLQFTKSSLGRCYILENIGHLFQSHTFAGAWIGNRPICNVTTFSATVFCICFSLFYESLGVEMEIIIRTKQLRKLHSRSVYQVMRFEPVDKHAGSCESRSQTWEPRLGLCRDDFYTQPSPFQTPFVDLKRVHIFRDVSSLSRP